MVSIYDSQNWGSAVRLDILEDIQNLKY